jgi:SAM-dependent methyltransferase
MENMEYFYELFRGLPRAGPGDNDSTRKAYSYMNELPVKPLILDIGCGPGMQTIELAKLSRGMIIALDNHQPFLDQLIYNAKIEKVQKNIIPKLQSVHEMDFEKGTFDVIWSEGALYFLGFKNGLMECYRLLKPGGYVAVTEAVYLKPDPPEPVVDFWEEYPDITNIQGNIELINSTNLDLIAHFSLPDSSWTDDYYDPMEKRIKILKQKYIDNEEALDVLESMQKEIDGFRKYSEYFGYEFFIMRKNE